MRIQHNIMALNAYRQLGGNNSALAKNLEKLSSGYRINRAGDDAAGLAISEKMRAQIKGLEAAQKNANDGISLVQTAEGALTEVHSMLNRMVYLATQSANGTYDNEVDRANLDKEVQTLKEEINRISQSTNFNGIKLLDGSMDSAIKTVNNKVSDSFKIADWVGTTANADAAVGAGTIVHKDAQQVQKAKFAVEFNNSTAIGENGVSIQLGENEKISLTKDEIAAGASAEDIAKAFAEKFKDDGVSLKSADGTDVKFNVTADGDRLVFEQAEDPKTASDIVNVSMAVKYEGIGAGAEAADRLNVTKPTVTVKGVGADKAKTTTNTVVWGNNVTDEQKDELNKILADGVKMSATVKYKTGPAIEESTLDVSKLVEALGDKYELVAEDGTGAKLTPDPTTGKVTSTETDGEFTLKIKDKESADTISTINIVLAADGTATASKTYSADLTLGAGDNNVMNTKPVVTIDDAGKLTDTATPTDLFALNGGITEEQLNALNKVLGADGQSITLKLDKLNGNNTATTSELTAKLSDALTDAGYKLVAANADLTAGATDGVFNVATANKALVLNLQDKDNNVIGTITIDGKDTNTAKNGQETKITLSQSAFNKEDTVTNGIKDEKVKVGFTAATPPEGGTASDINSIKWDNATDDVELNAGDKFTFTINGKDYSVEVADGGLTDEQKASGLYLDKTGLADKHANTLLAALQTQLRTQLTNEAKEAAKGDADYVEITNLTLAGVAGEENRINITANTTNYIKSENAANTPAGTDTPAGPAGKDPNASTVSIQTGVLAGEGRLASTYITDEDLAGLKDGSQLKVGDTVYTFAVGKDSKVTGDNVIKVNGEVGDADLGKKALDALSNMTNEMFSIGHDDTRVTFTENKEYKWGEGVDLGTHAGIAEQFGFYIDGMTSTTNGKALSLQVGDTADDYQKVGLDIKDMSTDGLDIADIDIKTQESASAAIDKIKAAINTVSSQRGDLGAIQNRLEHTINNLGVQTENITAAESRIRDTDMAEEMMAYTKNNILIQAAQAMLAQANQVPQGVLQLLQ